MKRIAIVAFYGVGALAIAYLALYAYAAFTRRDLRPGDPIHIFRKPDAPSYSAVLPSLRAQRRNPEPGRRTGLLRRLAPRNDNVES
jgi:hypothetical protein